jgi:hypothetical protein
MRDDTVGRATIPEPSMQLSVSSRLAPYAAPAERMASGKIGEPG